ncbi:MAG: hypothetical protein FRX49_09277 [Trebouxia sp. A1-2]|nr:MAG: hypothetical protein FRX49_09277 [Trebouxia sp. A1-2]
MSASKDSAAASNVASNAGSATAGAAGATAEAGLRQDTLGGVVGELSTDSIMLDAVLIGANICASWHVMKPESASLQSIRFQALIITNAVRFTMRSALEITAIAKVQCPDQVYDPTTGCISGGRTNPSGKGGSMGSWSRGGSLVETLAATRQLCGRSSPASSSRVASGGAYWWQGLEGLNRCIGHVDLASRGKGDAHHWEGKVLQAPGVAGGPHGLEEGDGNLAFCTLGGMKKLNASSARDDDASDEADDRPQSERAGPVPDAITAACGGARGAQARHRQAPQPVLSAVTRSAGACQSNPARTRAAAANGSGNFDGQAYAHIPFRHCAAAVARPVFNTPSKV